jgi:hypothetical protein
MGINDLIIHALARTNPPKPDGNNWMGVSVYQPDLLVTLGDITMGISLQGSLTPYNAKYAALFDAAAIKYIGISKAGKTIYQTWTGELPPDDIIRQALEGIN